MIFHSFVRQPLANARRNFSRCSVLDNFGKSSGYASPGSTLRSTKSGPSSLKRSGSLLSHSARSEIAYVLRYPRSYKLVSNSYCKRDFPGVIVLRTERLGHPQTSWATLTTRDSLASSASTVMLLPKTVLEKPHWGLSASCPRET